jgi:hypothetical protein
MGTVAKVTAIVALIGAVVAVALKGGDLYKMYQEYRARGCDLRFASADRTFTHDLNDGDINYSLPASCPRVDPTPRQTIVEADGGERPPTKEEMPLDNYYEKSGPIIDGDRAYYVIGYHFSVNRTGKRRKVVVSWLDETKGKVVLTQNP